MSRERFLAVVMGLSRRRSSGLLRRSLTFCFSRERSFRLGSEATQRIKESNEVQFWGGALRMFGATYCQHVDEGAKGHLGSHRLHGQGSCLLCSASQLPQTISIFIIQFLIMEKRGGEGISRRG